MPTKNKNKKKENKKGKKLALHTLKEAPSNCKLFLVGGLFPGTDAYKHHCVILH